MPTLYEIAKTIRRPADLAGKATKTSPPLTEGLTPATPYLEEGGAWLSPAELLAIEVPVLSLNGSITGYQREKIDTHVRAMARAMKQGKPFPAATIGIDENGVPAFTDGQHRALAAVMAGMWLRVDVRKLTTAEQRELFAGQRRARSVAKSVLVLAGSDPMSIYVQDAFTSPASPWEGLISENGRGGQISPASLFDLVMTYAGDIISRKQTGKSDARFFCRHAASCDHTSGGGHHHASRSTVGGHQAVDAAHAQVPICRVSTCQERAPSPRGTGPALEQAP